MEITRPLRTQATGEVDACDVGLLVTEEGRRVTAKPRVVDLRTQVHRRLPVVELRIDHRAEVDRLGPLRELPKLPQRTTIGFSFISDGHLGRDSEADKGNGQRDNETRLSPKHLRSSSQE